jgi:hypothetical protein
LSRIILLKWSFLSQGRWGLIRINETSIPTFSADFLLAQIVWSWYAGRGNLKMLRKGGHYGKIFFEVILFHPTMRERGIRKCSKRGVSMAKFFWSLDLVFGRGIFSPYFFTKFSLFNQWSIQFPIFPSKNKVTRIFWGNFITFYFQEQKKINKSTHNHWFFFQSLLPVLLILEFLLLYNEASEDMYGGPIYDKLSNASRRYCPEFEQPTHWSSIVLESKNKTQ